MTQPAVQVHPAAEACDLLERHFASVAQRDGLPSVTFGLVLGGETAVGSVGDADEAQQTRICSMTKSFTAAAVLALRDAGALRLDDLVADWLPEVRGWRLPAGSPPLTLRMLMTMSAGLPTDDPWGDCLLDCAHERLDALLRAGVTFSSVPGTRFEYANLGWVLTGRVVSTATGRRAQDAVDEHVLRPLGLHATTWEPSGAAIAGHRSASNGLVPETDPLRDGTFAPMGGLWSTPADICAWMSFLLAPGDGAPISASSARELQRAQVMIEGAEDLWTSGAGTSGYGLGLFDGRHPVLGRIVGHPGGLPGYGSCMRWLPQRRAGVVAFANRTYAPMTRATLDALVLLDEHGVLPPTVSTPPSAELVDAAERLVQQLEVWDEAQDPALFADNVLFDRPRDERIDDAHQLRASIGDFQLTELEPLTATSGVAIVSGAGGRARIRVLLSPEVPPRVQRYDIEVDET